MRTDRWESMRVTRMPLESLQSWGLGWHSFTSPDCKSSSVLPARALALSGLGQLSALRSAESWGIGDLLDLQRLAHWSATDLGARILLINPLNAATPALPQEASPYFPSRRRYRNLLYVHIEAVPGANCSKCQPRRLSGRTGRSHCPHSWKHCSAVRWRRLLAKTLDAGDHCPISKGRAVRVMTIIWRISIGCLAKGTPYSLNMRTNSPLRHDHLLVRDG